MSTNDIIVLDATTAKRRAERAPELSASDYFELFTAEEILKDYDLTDDEISSGIVAGTRDGGADSIYLLVNHELVGDETEFPDSKSIPIIDVVLIQSKTETGFTETAVEKLCALTEDLFDLSREVEALSDVYNSSVLEIMGRFKRVYKCLAPRFPSLNISYFYATRGDGVHPNVLKKTDKVKSKVRELFSTAKCEFSFLGAPQLLELVRRSPKTGYILTLTEVAPVAGQNAFVCLVRLSDFFKFLADEKGHLSQHIFESNVRDYQGSNQVNEGIHKTLQNSAANEDFWWLNNGITVIASKAALSSKMLTIEDPQIVNGLQTSRELFSHFAAHPGIEDTRNILVRVIVPSEAESRDRIIKATNSQTAIPVASLRATDKIHRDIEEYFAHYGLFYDRRKNFYKNEGKPIAKIFSIPYLAQAIIAIVLQRPNDSRARPSSVLKNDKTYEAVFTEKYPIGVYLSSAVIMKGSDYFLRRAELGLDRKDQTNLRFHLAMYVAAVMAQTPAPSPKEIDELKLPRDLEPFFGECYSRVRENYNAFGGSDQAVKGVDLVDVLKSDLVARFSTPKIEAPEKQD
jgi:AIPR protein